MSSCGTSRPVKPVIIKEKLIVAEPDPSLRTCGDEPAKRDLSKDDGTGLAQLLAEVFTWGRGCNSKLGATWSSIDDAKARAEKLNEGR